MIEKTFDGIIVERLKRSATGFPFSDGRPISRLDQLLAQGALTSRAVRAFGGSSLYGVVNGLCTEATIHNYKRTELLAWNMHLPNGVVDTYFHVVMSDIESGRLIVREPLNFLRCNDLPEIRLLADLSPGGLDAMAIMVRYAVKNSDVVSWLAEQGLAVPDWLAAKADAMINLDTPFSAEVDSDHASEGESTPRWSDELSDGRVKLGQMFDAIQFEIEARGYIPTCIHHGGIAELRQICSSDYPKIFSAESSFDNAWRELVALGKVRSYNHIAYGGKADSIDHGQ